MTEATKKKLMVLQLLIFISLLLLSAYLAEFKQSNIGYWLYAATALRVLAF